MIDDPEPLASPADASAVERQRMIDDIMTDTSLPVAEKQARLQSLAAEWGLRQEFEGDDIDPLEAQVFEALSMLAEGGHS